MNLRSQAARDEATEELKKLFGIPPYDGASNICCGDGYFAKSLVQKYGMSIDQLESEVEFKPIRARWEKARKDFIG